MIARILHGAIVVAAIAVCASGDAFAAVVDVGPCDGNVTPAVVSAAARRLHFIQERYVELCYNTQRKDKQSMGISYTYWQDPMV